MNTKPKMMVSFRLSSFSMRFSPFVFMFFTNTVYIMSIYITYLISFLVRFFELLVFLNLIFWIEFE
jgi:hypothetical protein